MQSTIFEQLNSTAARAILAQLPQRIQQAFIERAAEMDYPVEAPLEMALAGYLDSGAIAFADCKPERGLQSESKPSFHASNGEAAQPLSVSEQNGREDWTRNLDESRVEFRDRVLFGHSVDWNNREKPPGVSERFDGLTLKGIKALLAEGWLTPADRMNGTPTVEAFVTFLRMMERSSMAFGLEGFAFDPGFESGSKVWLEGIGFEGSYSAEVGLAFARFVAPFKPDELCLEPSLLRAWWD